MGVGRNAVRAAGPSMATSIWQAPYVRGLGTLLALQGVGGAMLKLAQGRGDDLAHNGLHLLSGLLGLALASGARPRAGARHFALGFGLCYLGLGALAWIRPNPFGVLPLGPGDHLFHLTIGALTLAVGLLPAGEGR